MATRTISVAGGNWNNVAAWDEGAVPIAGDAVVARGGGDSGNLTINVASACASIILTNYVGTLTYGATLTTTSTVTYPAGMTVAGTADHITVDSCTITVACASGLTGGLQLGGTSKTFTLGANLVIAGTLTISAVTAITFTGEYSITAGNITRTSASAAALTWTLSGTLTIAGAFTFSNGALTFAGNFNVSVGTLTNTTFTNPRTIKLVSGTTWTINTALNIASAAVNNTHGMLLQSTTPASQATLTLAAGATQNVAYVDVTDINSSAGQTIFTCRGAAPSNSPGWSNAMADFTDKARVAARAIVLLNQPRYYGDVTLGDYYPPNSGEAPYAADPSKVVSSGKFGAGNATTGTYNAVAANDARYKGAAYFGVTGSLIDGNCRVPTADQTLYGVAVDTGGSGRLALPNADSYGAVENPELVLATYLGDNVYFGLDNATQGTATGGIAPADIVAAAYVVETQRRYEPDGAYGTLAQDDILTTGTGVGIGHYVQSVASEIWDEASGGTAYGAAGGYGTFNKIAYGAAAYGTGQAHQLATDVLAVAAELANMTTAVVDLLDAGNDGQIDMSLYTLISGITWPALDAVDGEVNFGPVTGLEYEGEGMNIVALTALLVPLATTEALGIATGAILDAVAKIELEGVATEVKQDAAQASLDILTGGAGAGAWVVSFTVTDDSSVPVPLQSARVRVTINAEDYTALTDENGVATFGLGTAGTYAVSCSLAGYQFAGESVAISDDTNLAIEMSTNIITPATDPVLTHVVGYVVDGQGLAVVGAEVQFVITAAPSGKGRLYQGVPIKATSGAGGLIDLYLLRSASYRCSTTRMSFIFSTDAEASYEIPAAIII